MNAMGHDIPNVLGVDQSGVEEKLRALLPGYMAMGQHGMEEMTHMHEHMQGPENTLPMMGGDGPFGSIGMGGMFTILKVRKTLKRGEDAGWYDNPKGTVAYRVDGPKEEEGAMEYVCPMHPEVRQDKPGNCPKCGMELKPEKKKESKGHQH